MRNLYGLGRALVALCSPSVSTCTQDEHHNVTVEHASRILDASVCACAAE